MKQKRIVIALLAASMVMPLAAAAEWTVYGRAHLSADFLDDGADYSEFNISSNSSRLGFKGEREFRQNLTGMFQIEQEIFFDDAGTEFATRDTFAGLKGDWGMLRVGKFDTPFKRARGPANFFGDQLGDLRNVARTRTYGRFDERFRNSLHYRSPSLSGFVWDIQYSPERTDRTTTEGSDTDGVSTSIGFRQGGLNLAVAYEKQFDGAEDPDGFRLAASYRVIPALNVGALYQVTESTAGDEGTVFGIGGQYRINPEMFLNAHYFMLDGDLNETDASLFAIGLEYRVDSALRFYGNIGAVSNDDNAALTPWGAGRSATPGGAAGETAKGISFGMRYDF
nr:porin [Thioalkalivibrio sp.]